MKERKAFCLRPLHGRKSPLSTFMYEVESIPKETLAEMRHAITILQDTVNQKEQENCHGDCQPRRKPL